MHCSHLVFGRWLTVAPTNRRTNSCVFKHIPRYLLSCMDGGSIRKFGIRILLASRSTLNCKEPPGGRGMIASMPMYELLEPDLHCDGDSIRGLVRGSFFQYLVGYRWTGTAVEEWSRCVLWRKGRARSKGRTKAEALTRVTWLQGSSCNGKGQRLYISVSS